MIFECFCHKVNSPTSLDKEVNEFISSNESQGYRVVDKQVDVVAGFIGTGGYEMQRIVVTVWMEKARDDE